MSERSTDSDQECLLLNVDPTLTRRSSAFDLPIAHQGSLLNRPDSSAYPLNWISPTSDRRTDIDRRQIPASCLVISGGTGCNEICSAFRRDTCYVLPISDDGGSSSEIIRVFGGPSVGDIRSRLIRLIPDSGSSSPLNEIKTLLAHRFSVAGPDIESSAREAWRNLVEGKSDLWSGIPADRKEMIRGFLVFFENEVLRRSNKSFSFRNGSVGNFFLAGAQQFFRSLPSAIFLFSSITNSQATILPAIVTNSTCTLAANLVNGATVVGQCQISHPASQVPVPEVLYADVWQDELPDQSALNVSFTKTEESESSPPLASPISEVFYINAYGHKIFPHPNEEFLRAIDQQIVLVYSCGSLWTSIMPCLALKGVGDAITRSSSLRAKILLLNCKNDRETAGYSATDYILAIAKTLTGIDFQNLKSERIADAALANMVSECVTHLVYMTSGEVEVQFDLIQSWGIKCHPVASDNDRFNSSLVQDALSQIVADYTSTCT